MITIPLQKSTLLARVQAMTSKQSEVSASAAQSDKRTAFVQQATDSHEDQLLLLSSLRSAIDALYVFLSGETFGIESISDTLSDNDDAFEINIEQPPRFNTVMLQPLRSAFSDFIVTYMLFQWYSAFSTSLASSHFANLTFLQQNIARCFRKVSSGSPTGLFPSEVHFDYEMPEFIDAGATVFVPYRINEEASVNDICLGHLPKFVEGFIDDRGVFLTFRSTGVYKVDIFSYHNTAVSDSLNFIITPNV